MINKLLNLPKQKCLNKLQGAFYNGSNKYNVINFAAANLKVKEIYEKRRFNRRVNSKNNG
jgi:hypothetical protein